MSGLFNEVEHFNLPDAELYYWPAFLGQEEAQTCLIDLQQSLAWRQDEIVIAGKTIPVPRLNVWYGDERASYTYSGIHFESLPWTVRLHQLRDRIEQQVRADTSLAPAFNSVLANWYRHGQDSVAWHADDEPELGSDPLIASLSLGATRRFCLRHNTRGDRFELPLTSGSLLVMAGRTQHHWQHQVPKEQGVTEGRINLTFRRVTTR